ncbi:MAG: hypothetical protein JXA82_01460 [Sedimentisphaerales bacterium]|nr:hypothetical protein [Sedimentisphaerales bacterium]
MQIMVITEEEELYLPLSIEVFLNKISSEIMEVVCVRNLRHSNWFVTILKFYRTFGIRPLISHAFRIARAKLLNTFPALNRTGRFFSIKNLCDHYKVPYSTCENVNATPFLQDFRTKGVDLIVAISPSQIFKEKLISLPRYGCINIHSSKLPMYRGLYPTYWAMSCGEKRMGITIHYIEKGIDTGKIIVQEEVEIPAATTLHHMLTVTKIKGAELAIKAIKQIENGSVQSTYGQGSSSYYSFPTAQSYRQFKQRGYRLW